MISRTARLCRRGTPEAELLQVKPINERVNHPDRIVLANPVLKTIWKQRNLAAISTFNKAAHKILRSLTEPYLTRTFLHSQGHFLPCAF